MSISYIRSRGLFLSKIKQDDINSCEIQSLISKIINDLNTIDTTKDIKTIKYYIDLNVDNKKLKIITAFAVFSFWMTNFGIKIIRENKRLENMVRIKINEFSEDEYYGRSFIELRNKLNKIFKKFDIKF
jgi:hypothetical protein